MSRFINPAPEFKPSSKLYFYKSGTNSPLITYSDQNETTPNTHPVLASADGLTPNIFYSGSAKLVVYDQNDVQYIERDPVGGEKELGDFTIWDTVVTYDKNDIAEYNDKFYQSFSNGNQGNDPELVPTAWFEIRSIGVWNTNKTYVIGDVVQTTSGALWRSMAASNQGNEPNADDGTNWLPSVESAKIPEIIALTWLNKTTDFAAVLGEAYQIDGSSNTVDVTLPALTVGATLTFHSMTGGTFKIQLLNPSYTINGPAGTISAGTDLELTAGNSLQLIAKSTTVLEIVGAQI